MNAVHQLRARMLDLRTSQILQEVPDYNFQEEQTLPPPPSLLKEYKAPLDIDVFSGRMKRHIRQKKQKKGQDLKPEGDEEQVNLQNPENEYLDLDDILGKLKTLDDKEKEKKVVKKTWAQLTDDEQAEHLVKFVDGFAKKGLSEEYIYKLKKDIIDKFENCYFDKNKYIVWNKNNQMIYEIKKLFIGKDEFYWE